MKTSHHEKRKQLKRNGYSKEEIIAALAHAGHKKIKISKLEEIKQKKEEEVLKKKKANIKKTIELSKKARIEKLNKEIKELEEKIKQEKLKQQNPENKPKEHKSELEKKVESFLKNGFDEEAITSALLALGNKEFFIKRALKKIKKQQKAKQPKKTIIYDTSKTKTEVDDIYYKIKEEEQITVSDLAYKLNMPIPHLKKWLD